MMRLRQGSSLLSSPGGSVEPSPLVVKDGGLALPLSPSPGHWMQSVDVLPQAGVECLLEGWTSLTSPNLDVGLWISNCWMSSLTELVPCCRLESFCHAIASQFGSVNMRSTSASNLSIVIGVSKGLRTCWIL